MDEFTGISSRPSKGQKVIPLFEGPLEPRQVNLLEHASRTIGPQETRMRKALAGIANSAYEDTFDWSIYDRVAAKFGSNQPRGGVVFNTGLKLVNYHSSCSKCHYAFEVDTYGRGCTHNCVYCYAKEILTRHGYWNEPHPFPLNLANIRKIFYTVFETDRRSKWRDILTQRIPLRLGSMSDCFMWMDKKYRVSYELLKILNFYRYPHIVFTRSDLIAHEDYLNVMDRDLIAIQFSMSGGNESLTRALEPGAPGVKRRLEALRVLADNDFWTTVRINPLFPIYPDGYYTDEQSIVERFGSKANAPKFPLFDWEFISSLAEAKVPSVVAGVVRLTPFAVRAISKETGVDYSQFFKPGLFSKSSDSRFSDSEIAFYYKKLQWLCAKHKIRFNTCYIGNGMKDYYQHQSLWDNKRDCCDARGSVPSFGDTSQDIPWEKRLAHAPCKEEANNVRKAETNMDRSYLLSPSSSNSKNHPTP